MEHLKKNYPKQVFNLKTAGAKKVRFRAKTSWGAVHLEGLFHCRECRKPRWVSGLSAAVRPGNDSLGLCRLCGSKRGIKKLRDAGFIGGGGPANNNWKGGRSVRADGYVLVQIPPESPFACMGRNKSGRAGGWIQIFEHRLVMAQHIGRPLLSREPVHHRDGNPSNNAIENLLLLTNCAEHNRLERRLIVEKIARLEKLVEELTQENERLRCAGKNHKE